MSDDERLWRLLGDPQPREPGFAARALDADKKPHLMYYGTIWVLVSDIAASECTAECGTATTYRLEFGAHVSSSLFWPSFSGSTVEGAQLRRAVEPLSVTADDGEDAVPAVEQLLVRAARAIDRVLR